MSDYFGGKGLGRAVGCLMAAIAVALLAIGAAVGLLIAYLIWGGA
jgi:hypothetical protein